MARQIQIDTYIKNCQGGKVNIVNKVGRPPKQEKHKKGKPRPLRFLPRTNKAIDNAICAEWNSYQEFGEFILGEVGTVYTKNQMIKLANYFQQLAPIIDVLPDVPSD